MRLFEKMIKFKTQDLYVGTIAYYDRTNDRFVSLITKDVVAVSFDGVKSVLTNKEYVTQVKAKNSKEEFVYDVIMDFVPYVVLVNDVPKVASKYEIRKLLEKLNSHYHKDEILVMRAYHKFWEHDVLACLNDNAYYLWNSKGIDETMKLGAINENGDFVFWNGNVITKQNLKKLVDKYPEIMKFYKKKVLTPKQISQINEEVMLKSWNDENMP